MSEYLSQMFNGFFAFAVRCRARLREARRLAREARRRRARYTRLRLEWLDERIVPSIDTFTGPAGGAWTTNAYWSLARTPGSMDTAVISAGSYCVLSGAPPQTVAGLTLAGRLDISSKLSVTTASTASGSIFNVLTAGEVDVLGSADLGGGGTIGGQIDAQGSSVTFDPGSGMVAGAGATLSGSLFNVFGPLTVTGALNQNAHMILSNDGGVTTKGSLAGPGSMSDGAEFDWDSGTIGLAGGADFIASADLKLQTVGTKTLSAGILTNQCNGSELGGTGSLDILPGATFDNLGNPSCEVTLPFISTMGSGKFINDADGFFDEKGSTVISGNFTNFGTLEVGTASALTLSQGGGSVMDLSGVIQLDGDLTLLGSILSSMGFIEDSGGGTLKIGMGGSAGALSVASGEEALLEGNVEVLGSGTLNGGGEVYNNGKLTLDLGATTGFGSYQQTLAGILVEQAMGPGANTPLVVAGAAQLAGVLELNFLDGYTPKSGDSFTVLKAGSVGAHFDTLPHNMTASYGPTGVSVTEK